MSFWYCVECEIRINVHCRFGGILEQIDWLNCFATSDSLAAAGGDGVITFWDMRVGKQLASFCETHEKELTKVRDGHVPISLSWPWSVVQEHQLQLANSYTLNIPVSLWEFGFEGHFELHRLPSTLEDLQSFSVLLLMAICVCSIFLGASMKTMDLRCSLSLLVYFAGIPLECRHTYAFVLANIICWSTESQVTGCLVFCSISILWTQHCWNFLVWCLGTACCDIYMYGNSQAAQNLSPIEDFGFIGPESESIWCKYYTNGLGKWHWLEFLNPGTLSGAGPTVDVSDIRPLLNERCKYRGKKASRMVYSLISLSLDLAICSVPKNGLLSNLIMHHRWWPSDCIYV